MRLSAGIVVFIALLALSGCGQSKPPKAIRATEAASSKQPAKDSQQPNIVENGITPLRLESDKSLSGIDVDSWASETFTQETDGQLKLLAKLLTLQGPIKSEQLAPLVTDAFTAQVPPRDVLREVFAATQFSVSRATNSSTKQPQVLSNFADFKNWLPYAFSRIKFKTFGVDVLRQSARTTVWMRADMSELDRRINVSAIWNCEWIRVDGKPKLRSLVVEDFEQVNLSSSEPLFSDCTESILGKNESYHQQLVYGQNHWLKRLQLYDGIIAISYQGLAVGDVNGDGLDDVYVCQPGGAAGGLPNRLFVQQPDGTAIDMSVESGTDWLIETTSALLIDLNNDGHQDLVAATIAGLIFAENDGQGHFQPKLHKIAAEAPVISIAAADFDNDGDLDIYAASYGRRAAADVMGRPIPYHDANNGARNTLFRNDRDWRFTNVTKRVGLEQNNTRFSLACSWEDYDKDGDQDLYVANDFGRNNLYRNDGGRFVDVAAAANVEDMSAGMSVAWGDYDNDGRSDLYVSNMWSSAGNRIAYQRQFLSGNTASSDPAAGNTLAGFRRHARGNSLFRNVIDSARQRPDANSLEAAFSDVSEAAHTTMGGWAWSSSFVDINNDGWEDLVVANGNITQRDPQDL